MPIERIKKMKDPSGLFFVLVGLFFIAGGLLDWDWIMNNPRARIFVKILDRIGARILYCILGLAIVIFGLLITFGIITERTS